MKKCKTAVAISEQLNKIHFLSITKLRWRLLIFFARLLRFVGEWCFCRFKNCFVLLFY